jgi:hypothetical protein
MKRERCSTIVMGHRCTLRENHTAKCKFKDFVPPSERWDKVANERCVCKHLKTQHDGIGGHRDCMREGCTCNRFTWEAFLDSEGKEI